MFALSFWVCSRCHNDEDNAQERPDTNPLDTG